MLRRFVGRTNLNVSLLLLGKFFYLVRKHLTLKFVFQALVGDTHVNVAGRRQSNRCFHYKKPDKHYQIEITRVLLIYSIPWTHNVMFI